MRAVFTVLFAETGATEGESRQSRRGAAVVLTLMVLLIQQHEERSGGNQRVIEMIAGWAGATL